MKRSPAEIISLILCCSLLLACMALGTAVSLGVLKNEPVNTVFKRWQTKVIRDATQACSFALDPGDLEPGVVVIRVTGHLKGSAELLVGDMPLFHLEEDVDLKRVRDWYDGPIAVEYKPKRVAGGQVMVQWKFGGL